MAYGTRVRFEELREAAFGVIGAAYAAVGGSTSDHTRLVSFFNSTDTDVYISLNGATNHLRIAAGSGQVLDLTTNKVRDDGLFIDEGTFFYAKRAAGAPSSGSLWIQVMYADGGV
jgi:hypothetical protein